VLEVIVGVALTALFSGLLVPALKDRLERRSEQYSTSVTLVSSLWTYWKLALRVAYYGREGQKGRTTFCWPCAVGTAMIRAGRKRNPDPGEPIEKTAPRSRAAEDRAQQEVVDYLDGEIRRLRDQRTPDDWGKRSTRRLTPS
jgi:hypothetical protein